MLIALILSVWTFLVLAVLRCGAEKEQPFKRALLSMALGLLTLGVVDLLAGLTGVYIPVTWLTMGTSLVGGIPGVALLVLLSAF